MKNKNPGKLTPNDALRELWARGVLSWKLHDVQKQMLKELKEQNKEVTVIACSRRLGKSYLLCLLAVEKCIQTPNAIIKYVCPRKNMVKTIINPIMTEILKDCPKEMAPEFKTNDYMYVFPNGSMIQMAGTDNGHHENIRGGKSDMWIVDEAGFCDDLNYVVRTILAPTADTTGGKGIIASTPSKSPDHEFITEFMKPAQQNNHLIKYTIYDNPLITREKLNGIIERYPLKERDPEFRREYLCEVIGGGDLAIFPEFDEELEQKIVKEVPRPSFFDAYASMDIGGADMTVILFGYYDFKTATTVIEDELVFHKKTDKTVEKFRIDTFANAIRKKEEQLWTSSITGEFKPPYLRISDNNNIILLNDLTYQYNIQFIPTRKDNRDAAINTTRVKLAEEKIIIHPRCKTLIFQLRNGTWAKNKKDFSRTANNGHWDACFIPGSRVLTSTGYKNIEDIVINDEVLTHTGQFKKVLNTMSKYYDGNLIKTSVPGRSPVYSTPEHSFFASEKYRNKKEGMTGQIGINSPTWIKAKELINHKVFVPNIPESTFNISNEMCFLYGYYVAEGSLSGNGRGVQFAGHNKEKNVSDILWKAVVDQYGPFNGGQSRRSKARHKNKEVKPRTKKLLFYSSRNNTNGRLISISEQRLWKELKKLGKSSTKRFPDWHLSLSYDQSLYMLAGYLFGDAHFSSTGTKSSTISKNILEGTDHLARKLGLIASCKGPYSREIGLDHYVWSLDKLQSQKLNNLIQSKPDLSFIFEDKLVYKLVVKNEYHYPSNYRNSKIQEIADYSGMVYNIEVEDDNSYTVNDIAVHNCAALVYLIRNIQESKNPYPPGHGFNFGDNGFLPSADKVRTKNEEAWVSMFKQRKSINTKPSTDSERTKQIVNIFNKKK